MSNYSEAQEQAAQRFFKKSYSQLSAKEKEEADSAALREVSNNMHEPKSVKCARGQERYGTKDNSVADKIMQIDSSILEKHGSRTGVDPKEVRG